MYNAVATFRRASNERGQFHKTIRHFDACNSGIPTLRQMSIQSVLLIYPMTTNNK
jgi:hypothetical protein